MALTSARPKLSRRLILETALDMIDREGLEALSMRRLGAELGTEAMSLYRHVADKDEVLDGVVELLADELEVPAVGAGPWRETVGRVMASYRQAALAHPRAFPLLALRPFATPRAAEREEAMLELLRRAGFAEEGAHLAFRALGSFANGHLLEEVAAPADGRERWEAAFEFGLRVVLNGLEAELDRPAPGLA